MRYYLKDSRYKSDFTHDLKITTPIIEPTEGSPHSLATISVWLKLFFSRQDSSHPFFLKLVILFASE